MNPTARPINAADASNDALSAMQVLFKPSSEMPVNKPNGSQNESSQILTSVTATYRLSRSSPCTHLDLVIWQIFFIGPSCFLADYV